MDTAARIRDLKGWAESSGLSGFLDEGFAANVLAGGNAAMITQYSELS
jgi:hypothetical protein